MFAADFGIILSEHRCKFLAVGGTEHLNAGSVNHAVALEYAAVESNLTHLGGFAEVDGDVAVVAHEANPATGAIVAVAHESVGERRSAVEGVVFVRLTVEGDRAERGDAVHGDGVNQFAAKLTACHRHGTQYARCADGERASVYRRLLGGLCAVEGVVNGAAFQRC